MQGKATAAPRARETRDASDAGAVVVSLPAERRRRRPNARTALEGRRFTGIELDPTYAEIARARIAHWAAVAAGGEENG